MAEPFAPPAGLDVCVLPVDTPWGRMHVAATPTALVRVCLPGDAPPPADPTVPPTIAEHAADALLQACAGEQSTWPTWSLVGVPEFSTAVLKVLAQVPAGHTVTYGELARAAGNPAAVRAAACACARNPLPIVVPCHRVLPATGGVGAYRGGPTMKEALLAAEGIRPT